MNDIENIYLQISSLSILDFSLVLLYFASIIAIGYWSSKRQKPEDYLIAERNIGWFQTMATVNASRTGSMIMTLVAAMYIWGFGVFWAFVGMGVGWILFIPFALKLKDNSQNKYTLADYFQHHYGQNTAYIVSLMTILLMLISTITNLIAGTKVFMYFTDWSFSISALVMVIVVLVYLLMGGYRAVVRTDMVQYISIVLILIILLISIFNNDIIPKTDWSMVNVSTGTLFGFFLLGLVSPFSMPELWQRVYSAKDKKTIRNGLFFSTFMYFLVGILLCMIGLTVKNKFPAIDPDLALLHGFSQMLPSGLLGLSLVLLLASIMSSIDTYIFTGASALVQDFYKGQKERVVLRIKWTMIAFTIIGIIFAIPLQNLVAVVLIGVGLVGVVSTLVIATWIIKSIQPMSLLAGALCGFFWTTVFVANSLAKPGGISPAIMIVAMLASILGMCLSGLVLLVKKLYARR